MKARQILGSSAAGIVLLGLTACGDTSSEDAADFPVEDVTIYVPYAAGGSTDTLARSVAQGLGDHFGQTFVVENRPGAGGATTISAITSGPSDGTSLAILASPTFLIPSASGQADYTVEDLRPVGVISEQPVLLIENGSAPDDFLETAESERKTVGTNGPDTAAGIDIDRLTEEGGLELEQIPFEGQSELLTNLMGGNLDAVVVNATPDVLEGIEEGDYNAIATFATERIDYLPDTPTFVEEGYDMASNATSQFGLVGPQDIDEEAYETLSAALSEILQDDQIREQIGEDYMADEFIDGPAWSTQISDTNEVYESFFGED